MPLAGITDLIGPTLGAEERNPGEVSRIDFMTLLVAQIQNQDPMSPMDNQQFTSQITQFTMLGEMEKTNRNLEESLIMAQAINNTAMLGLVGKNVTVEGDQVQLTDGVVTGNMIVAELPGTVFVEVKDSTGTVVASYTKSVTAGLSEIDWNGLDNNEEVLPDGEYTIDVKLTSTHGADIPFKTLMTGAVDGLRYENNQAVVIVGDTEYFVSEIYKVS